MFEERVAPTTYLVNINKSAQCILVVIHSSKGQNTERFEIKMTVNFRHISLHISKYLSFVNSNLQR